ncbi:TetR family transcriptional regulator [Actinomadura sp. CNU-125]|uniref:TetR/AcrR family transcriptional regulator n=1 Tax=Actinomadura sp. CNU-125 TaxID=1904961 RepID=UPI000968F286|nr:helix-turn-helix domain-containing protein [Actinomadura sp. CNU-125]OLT32593.1 TetR family transcriptional regulator [Actinomadura sp. CNU-125]
MEDEDGGRAMGLRERKKLETRDALSAAAIGLIVERGWSAVTIEDIAAAANVSVRTFRNYFSGKAEAVAARHVDRMRRVADGLRARPADEPLWDAIGAAVQEQFGSPPDRRPPDPDGADGADAEGLRRRADGVRLLLGEPALAGEMAKAHAAAEAELAAAIAERTGTDTARDLYPGLTAAVLGAAVGAAIVHALRGDRGAPVGPVLREALDRLTAGLPTP